MNELSPRINNNRSKVILGLVSVAAVSAPAEAHHIVFCCFSWHGPNSGFRSYCYKSQIALRGGDWGRQRREREREGMGFLESLQRGIIGAAQGWTGPCHARESLSPGLWPAGARAKRRVGASQACPPGRRGAAGCAGGVLRVFRLGPCYILESPCPSSSSQSLQAASLCFLLMLVISPSTSLISFLPWH